MRKDSAAQIVHVPIADLTLHPAADEIPEMNVSEWADFLADVSRSGVQEPLAITAANVVLDGRHRLRAAEYTGQETVPVRVVDVSETGETLYMIRAAAMRRNLSESQRAILAARLKPKVAAEAKERKSDGGKQAGRGRPKKDMDPGPQANGTARDLAGQAVGVSGRSVDRAEKVLSKGAPEVIRAVEAGELPVKTAARLVEAPKADQVRAIQGGKQAIKETIQKHAPTASEVAANDPGVQFYDAMRVIGSRLRAAREKGGVQELIARWRPELREEYRDDIAELIEELTEWKNQLTTSLQKHSRA